MYKELRITIESIIVALETEKDEHIDEIKRVDTHTMYLVGKIDAYKNVLYILDNEYANA
jgi:hypothetical protein